MPNSFAAMLNAPQSTTFEKMAMRFKILLIVC